MIGSSTLASSVLISASICSFEAPVNCAFIFVASIFSRYAFGTNLSITSQRSRRYARMNERSAAFGELWS
jgi:hypothetical protein